MKNTTVLIITLFITIGGLWLFFGNSSLISSLNDERISNLYNSIHSLSVTLFGILLAVLAVFSSLINHNFISKMKKTGHFKNLIRSIFWNTTCFFCLICLTFIKPFLNYETILILLKINLIILAISFFLLLNIGKKFWFLFCGLSKP